MSNFTPTDEQIDALADAFAQYTVVTNPQGLSASIAEAYDVAEALTESTAFQAIIRAAKAKAWEEGAKFGVNYDLGDYEIPQEPWVNPYTKESK